MQVFSFNLPILRRALAGLTALLTLLIARFYPEPPPEYYPDTGVTSFVLVDALVRAQGITTDGENLYFGWNFGLTKTDLTGRYALRIRLLPLALLRKGVDHIGGVSYYDGKIYCAMEDSGVFENLYIGVYDAKTLKMIGYKAVPLENHEFGIPWVAVDRNTGLLYSARRDHFEVLNIYDAESLELVDTLALNAPVHKIQGGEVHGGVLYVADSREGQAVFAINLVTGQVQKLFSRFVPGGKGQGLTILPADASSGGSGAFFYILDEDTPHLSIHMRAYAFDPASLAWYTP